MEFSKEQIEKARNCKTLDEFKSLAKAEGVELSDEEALKYFNSTRNGELSDEELSSVAGGKKSNPKFDTGDWVRLRKRDPLRDPREFEGRIFSMKYERRRWFYHVQGSNVNETVEESGLILVKKYNQR